MKALSGFGPSNVSLRIPAFFAHSLPPTRDSELPCAHDCTRAHPESHWHMAGFTRHVPDRFRAARQSDERLRARCIARCGTLFGQCSGPRYARVRGQRPARGLRLLQSACHARRAAAAGSVHSELASAADRHGYRARIASRDSGAIVFRGLSARPAFCCLK